MRRGDIVIARERGEFTGKARPFLVVQSDAMLDDAEIITVCPITSHLTHADLIRVAIRPDVDTGLKKDSEVEVDLISAIRTSRIAEVVGRIPDEGLAKVDAALRRWLDL